ncbi:MAG: NUDIX domain-containing protein, partial [Oscillospiraceae bacterium]
HKMQYEKSCGAIVYRKHHGNIELLLIKNANGGHWSFPKGHVEEGETEEQTALREIMEETSIEVTLDASFREVITYAPKRDVVKDVVYFLAKALTYDYIPQIEEISKIKWVEINNAQQILSYDNDRQIVAKAKLIIKDTY